MNPLVSELIGVLLRWALTGFGGYLVTHHVMTADQTDRFANAIVEHVLLWAPGGLALAWGLWAKYKGRIKFLTALESRQGITEDEVRTTIKNGMGAAIGAILLAGALAVTLPACAANRLPPTIVTPAGQSAYRADQVLDRLNEVSDLVIGDTGDFPGGIRPADAFTIIEWISGDAHAMPPTIGVAQLVARTPGQNWKATAKASWQARIRGVLLGYPSLAAYVPIVDALLEVL